MKWSEMYFLRWGLSQHCLPNIHQSSGHGTDNCYEMSKCIKLCLLVIHKLSDLWKKRKGFFFCMYMFDQPHQPGICLCIQILNSLSLCRKGCVKTCNNPRMLSLFLVQYILLILQKKCVFVCVHMCVRVCVVCVCISSHKNCEYINVIIRLSSNA